MKDGPETLHHGYASSCPGQPPPCRDPRLSLPGGPHTPQPGDSRVPLAPTCGQRPGLRLPVTHPAKGRAGLGWDFPEERTQGSWSIQWPPAPPTTLAAAQVIQGPQAGGHHSPLCPCLPSPHRSEGQCPWGPGLETLLLPPGLGFNPPALPSRAPWGWWRGLHFMSGRKRLLLLWQLGEFWLGPVGHTTSAEQGPYPSPLQSSLHPPCSPCPGTKRPTGNESAEGFAGCARAAGSSASLPSAQPAPCAGRQPSTGTSSSRRGCWLPKTCARPVEDHPPREESTPPSLPRPPADTSIR